MKIIRASNRPFVPASHENPLSPGVLKKVLLGHDDLPSGRVMMLNWARMPVGRAFQKHYHEDMDEFFLIVEGTVEMECGTERVTAGSGDLIVVPRREPHVMRNVGDIDIQYIVFGISSEQGGKTITLA